MHDRVAPVHTFANTSPQAFYPSSRNYEYRKDQCCFPRHVTALALSTMAHCCVQLCKSSRRSVKGISFHELPVTDIRDAWLRKVPRQAGGKMQTVCEVCRQTLSSAAHHTMSVPRALAGHGFCASIFLQTFTYGTRQTSLDPWLQAGPGKHPWLQATPRLFFSLLFPNFF